MAATASMRRDGDALVFSGALTRDAVPALWGEASRVLNGVQRFELAAVEQLDSAGLALLAALAERSGGVAVNGDPRGLPELRRAYRLSPALSFASA
jgi:phospholipid transport system transporter-binding protein